METDPKALELLGSSLVVLRERMAQTLIRVDNVVVRAFGAIEEIHSLPEDPPSEPAGEIAMLRHCVSNCENFLARINQSLSKVEQIV